LSKRRGGQKCGGFVGAFIHKARLRGAALESEFLLDLFYSRKEFSEPVDPGNLLLSFRKWNRGRAEPGAALGALRDATLGTDGGVIANFDMPNYTNLTAN
jgi:hypothetical protein